MQLAHVAVRSGAGRVQFLLTLGLGNHFVNTADAVAEFFECLVSRGVVVSGAGGSTALEWVDWGLGACGKHGAFHDLAGYSVLARARMLGCLDWKPFFFLNCPLARIRNLGGLAR